MHTLQAGQAPLIGNRTAMQLLQSLTGSAEHPSPLLFQIAALEDRKQALFPQLPSPSAAEELRQVIKQQQALLAKLQGKGG